MTEHLGSVAIVGAGPGDPELITVRGRRLLEGADVVLTDRLVPRALLDGLRAQVDVIDVGKEPYGHATPQEEIIAMMTAHARAGCRVVRLKGGDPFVFGRGGEEAVACRAAGIPCEVVPGVTSAVAAPAAAGIPVTHRGVTQHFTVVSGHAGVDDPDGSVDWAALGRDRGTLVLLMAVRHLDPIVGVLIRNGRDPRTPAAAVASGTLPGQIVVTAPLSEISTAAREARLVPPTVIVIGDVVAVRALLTS